MLDTIVVGAGLSGLCAARRLVAAGLSVAVLEARDRVGGRTLSADLAGERIDLGAQWIGPTQDRVQALTRELAIDTFAQHEGGRKVLVNRGKLRTYGGTIPSLPVFALIDLHRAISRVERLAARIDPADPLASPRARHWDAMSVAGWLDRHAWTRDARVAVGHAVRAVFAVEPAELSMLHFLAYVASAGGLMRLLEIRDGAQKTRFATGSQELCRRLAAPLGERVALDEPVRAIVADGDALRVIARGGERRARRVIVATPPAVAARIAFEPALPARRAQLLQRMPMGSVIKCIAAYDEPFWRAAGLSGESVSDAGPITITFDDSPEHGRTGALVAFVLGDAARAQSEAGPEARRAAVLAQLASMFGERAARPTAYIDRDWCVDPWSGGCYAGYMAPGTATACARTLRAPTGRIHWAGTETAVRWNGYLDGAIEAGERAADEVIAALRQSPRPCAAR